MYKISETKDRTQMTSPPPFGPAFAESQVQAATRMEVWGSSFLDPGSDFCEFRLFDANGACVATRRQEGY